MPRITEMFAFVAADNGSDDEGVVGFGTELGPMAMVGADMARVKSLWPIAEQIAKTGKKDIRVLKFSVREEIGLIRGQ